MTFNIDDMFRGLEIEEQPALRLTDSFESDDVPLGDDSSDDIAASSAAIDIASTVIEDAGPLLKLTAHSTVTMLDARSHDDDELPVGKLIDRNPTPATTAADRPTVLHVRVVSATGGGPEKTILRSPKYANDEYFKMAVAYIHPKGDNGIEVIRSQAKKWNAPLFTIAEKGAIDLRTVRELYHLCRQQNVTIWHGHDYKSNLLGLILRRFWKMKLVTTVHGWTNDTFRTRMYYHVDKWCLKRYDEVIAVSPLLHQQCLEIGVKAERLTYVANGIDCTEYQRSHTIRGARRELGVFRDSFIMGVVARLSPEKGVDRAIRTVADLHVKYPNIELHIVGDGPEFDKLKRLAVELGVSGITHFWGFQSQSKRFFEMFDMLLLPSHTEGFPNVVLEAMAMGVPVAAADVGAVTELLKNGRRGVVLDAKEQETWADHIAPLIVSKDRRRELSRLGRHRIEKYYSFDQRMLKVFRVYDRVLSIAPQSERSEWRRAA